MTSLAEIYPQGVAISWTGTPDCDTQEMLDIRIEKLLPRIEQLLRGKANVIRQKLIPQKARNNERFEFSLAFVPNGRIRSAQLQDELGSKILEEFQMLFGNARAMNLNEF